MDNEIPGAVGENAYAFRMVPVDDIRATVYCHRERSEDEVVKLAVNIRRNGLISPLTVVPDGERSFMLVAGEGRYLACKKLGWTTVLCRVVTVGPAEQAALSISENSLTKHPDPVDQARKLMMMKTTFGLTEDEIAEMTGIAQSVVSERLSILRLPPDIVSRIDTRPEAQWSWQRRRRGTRHMMRRRTAGPSQKTGTRRYDLKRGCSICSLADGVRWCVRS